MDSKKEAKRLARRLVHDIAEKGGSEEKSPENYSQAKQIATLLLDAIEELENEEAVKN